MKVYLYPQFKGVDKGDGGVRRVLEAQIKHLSQYDWEISRSIEEADVVAAHIGVSDNIERFIGNKPLAVHNHGLYWADYDWPEWCHKANRACLSAIRQADIVTAPTDWVAQALRRASLRRIEVVGHGVDLEEWEPTASKGYVLWNKTRVDPICNPEPLNELARRVPETKFLTTFGDDRLPNVIMTGRLPYAEAKEAVRQAGIYLCTTKETFGIGTLEAMACGVPVLGWRWGGQTDIVDHQKTGWLAEPGDYQGLEEGLEYCLKNRAELGQRARQVVQELYQWSDVVKGYSDLYNRLAVKSEGPKVSVIVPAYNLVEYLPAALESVASQTLGDFECVVVDDASTDGTREVAEEFVRRDGRFSILSHQKNQYLATTLNDGIATARGRYIIALDADNLLPPTALELLSDALESKKGIHIAYGNVEFLESDGRKWHSGWPMQFRPDWQLTRRNKDRPANLIPSGAMYRKEVWDLTGGYRPRYRTAEDADFWTRATSYGFVAEMVTEADILIYRNRENSMSREEKLRDWTVWYPWCRAKGFPPAAVDSQKVAPVDPYDSPEVAVIIPVGPEHGELVIDALDSVDAQTYRNWECWIVNDSGKPLRWIPSWARLIETRGSLGVAAARNLGIQASRASLFVPLDADDVLEPEALIDMTKIQQRFGGYVYSDFYEQWEGKPLSVWETPDYDASLLTLKGCLHAVTGLYEKKIWDQVGGFNEELPAWEDWDFQLKMAAIGVCGTRIPYPLFIYRKETGFRREDNYSNFEKGKEAILSRWRPYFEGGKTLMGCSACPGGGKGYLPASPIQRAEPSPPSNSNSYLLVEYVGPREGIMTYRAPSGTIYNFSSLPTERQKYILAADRDFFAQRSDFAIRSATSPLEEAVV